MTLSRPDLLFISPFNADHGTEKITAAVINEAARRFSSVALLYSGGEGLLFHSLNIPEHARSNLGNQKTRALFYLNAVRMILFFLLHRPLVVFVVNHVLGMSAGLALSVLPKGFRPVSALSHHVYPEARTDPIEIRRMKRYFSVFDRHIVVSAGIAAKVAPYVGGTDRTIVTIPNGVDIYQIRMQRHAEGDLPPLPPHRWRCVYIGGLRPDKRVDRLLRAFARLPEKSSVALVLVGDGEARSQLEESAKQLGVSDRCLFVGHQTNPYRWLLNCDMLVQTSDWETFGLSVIEAMAADVPVLTMGDNSPGLQEIIRDGDNGRIITNGDITAFSAAWSQMLQDPEGRRRMAEGGLRTAETFSIGHMLSRYMQLLAELSERQEFS